MKKNTQKISGEGTGGIANKKENRSHSDYEIVEISEDKDKSPREGTRGIGNKKENRNHSDYKII